MEDNINKPELAEQTEPAQQPVAEKEASDTQEKPKQPNNHSTQNKFHHSNNANKAKNSDERNKRKVERKTKSEYEERVVKINRISKTTKGGRNLRFSALVVIGNRKGKVGFGISKALEVPNAIKKALRAAEKNVKEVFINKNGTMFHQVTGRSGAAKVLLKPAPSGTGIIAGGPIRAVIELAGYTDIYTKNLGKNTPVNMIQATMDGILKQYTPKQIAKLRGKELKDL